MSSEFIIHFIAAFIIIFISSFLITFLCLKLRRARKRSNYNLEYPADFVEKSSADEDMEDRFQGKHWK
jgi:hypothetical protein